MNDTWKIALQVVEDELEEAIQILHGESKVEGADLKRLRRLINQSRLHTKVAAHLLSDDDI